MVRPVKEDHKDKERKRMKVGTETRSKERRKWESRRKAKKTRAFKALQLFLKGWKVEHDPVAN